MDSIMCALLHIRLFIHLILTYSPLPTLFPHILMHACTILTSGSTNLWLMRLRQRMPLSAWIQNLTGLCIWESWKWGMIDSMDEQLHPLLPRHSPTWNIPASTTKIRNFQPAPYIDFWPTNSTNEYPWRPSSTNPTHRTTCTISRFSASTIDFVANQSNAQWMNIHSHGHLHDAFRLDIQHIAQPVPSRFTIQLFPTLNPACMYRIFFCQLHISSVMYMLSEPSRYYNCSRTF